ncbi:MAG: AIPR family protein [Pseudomonadota bacterium]
MSENIPEILNLFKEQLSNQVDSLVKDKGFENSGYGFAYWYFRHIGRMTDIEAKEQICDGGGDLGVDAIEIDDSQVVFYQFKNPIAIDKGFSAAEVDKMISGLDLILSRQHAKVANPELLARLQEIYAFTPSGYKIVIACSSQVELPDDARVKLDSFCEKNSGAARDLFSWEFHNLNSVHNKFYTANLPTLDATLDIDLNRPPYMTQIGDHQTYLFDLNGTYLALLYDDHGESLLQQNVRMFEGDRGTNLAIAETASSEADAKDFFHFNNGISMICDAATFQPFNNKLSLERPQIVNGGQTIRILHRCFKDGRLQADVHAAVRVITTGKDKEFASSVAVNLNNQTRVDNTFLRSNDPRIVQLLHSLAALGYFLERRAGEIDAMLPDEVKELETRFGAPLSDHVIPLKDGMQAYVATYYGDPQLAKKDSSKIFTDDGGSFSKILQSDLTAEKLRDAYELSRVVSSQVDKFKALKRKRYSDEFERKSAYIKEFGSVIEPQFDELDAAIPQITIFGMAVLYEKFVVVRKSDLLDAVVVLGKDPSEIWNAFVELIACRAALMDERSWPTLLKSGPFYRDAVRHLTAHWNS